MNQTDRKTLELALIIALGEFGSRATTGRLRGACEKIVKFVTRELEKLPPLTDKELEPMAVVLVVCLILLVGTYQMKNILIKRKNRVIILESKNDNPK